MKSIVFPAVLAATALVLTACAPKQKPEPKVSAEAHAGIAAANEGAVAATPVAPGPRPTGGAVALPVIGPAPAWQLKDLNGNAVTGDQFKGKVVVVDFWTTWCPPCRAEIPGYVELYRKYGDKLAIVGVSLDEKGPQVVQDFVKKFNVTYPIVMGDEKTVAAFGGMEAIPTTFLIDRNGQIRDKKVGAEPTEEYERKIQALLN